MLVIDDLEIRYDANIIVSGFNLQVRRGEHKVISGKSGSGKSSILHAILGFIHPASGRIFIDRVELQPEIVPELRHKIAWLPADPFTSPGSVYDIIQEIFAYKANRSIIPSKGEILAQFNKLDLDERIYSGNLEELSTGQKQRLALAICILLKRDLLLLDEPTSALDKNNREIVKRLTGELIDKAVLSVSHDPDWIQSADGVVEL